MDNIKKIKRTAQVITVLSKYGFEAIVGLTDVKKLIPNSYVTKNKKREEIFSLSIYERIRMVLEELGPTFIKLGQLLSNRDDLLPEDLTVELRKLQDDVTAEDIDIVQRLNKELGIDANDLLENINPAPIAAASLAQVYKATLKEGQQDVIIKIKRKGIQDIIESDLLIIKDFAAILEKYYDAAKNIGLCAIAGAFEKSILAELSFNQEFSNIERFRNNFKGNEAIYIPAVYQELSNNNILCMEFIDGIKISDRDLIAEHNLPPDKVADTVIDLYMKQVFDFGFFHADPHSGNVFVLPNGQIVFIDYGSVGKMSPLDKEHLSDLIIYTLRKDVNRMIRVIKKSAVKYSIPNESGLERDLYELIDIIDSTSIKDLSMTVVCQKFSTILNQNRIILPDYMYLLIRGIVLLEGIGREICPDINIVNSIKPYGVKLVRKKLAPEYIAKKTIDKIYDLSDKLDELPDDIHSLVQRINKDELKVSHNISGLADIKNTINRLAIAIIILALSIGSAILILADMPPKLWGIPILGFVGFIFSGILSIIVVLGIIRNKKEE